MIWSIFPINRWGEGYVKHPWKEGVVKIIECVGGLQPFRVFFGLPDNVVAFDCPIEAHTAFDNPSEPTAVRVWLTDLQGFWKDAVIKFDCSKTKDKFKKKFKQCQKQVAKLNEEASKGEVRNRFY